MDQISTTQLRTKTPQLVETLRNGHGVTLIHRSKQIGIIKPQSQKPSKTFNKKRFLKNTAKLKLPKISLEKIDVVYRQAMERKHGTHIS